MGLVTPSGGLLFWMVIIFGVVFFVLAKFGFPIITSMVRKRNDYIADSLREAGQARAQIEGVEEKCRQLIDEARQEQSRMMEQAQASARQTIEDAKAAASREAAQLIARAREDIALEQREALSNVRNVVAELSVAVSEKILREKLSAGEAQSDFVTKAVDQVSAQQQKLS